MYIICHKYIQVIIIINHPIKNENDSLLIKKLNTKNVFLECNVEYKVTYLSFK